MFISTGVVLIELKIESSAEAWDKLEEICDYINNSKFEVQAIPNNLEIHGEENEYK